MNNKQIEYVYCLSNKSFNENLVKIGWTTKEPRMRAQQLYTTGVPTPFKIEFFIKTYDGRTLESRIHSYLSRLRKNNSREFFVISVDELRKILIDKMYLTLTEPGPEVKPERSYHTHKYTFERCSQRALKICKQE